MHDDTIYTLLFQLSSCEFDEHFIPGENIDVIENMDVMKIQKKAQSFENSI